MAFKWNIQGLDGNKNSWTTEGVIHTDGPLKVALEQAQKDSFNQLTGGKATYGQPGVAGCKGPYTITRVLVERE